MAESGALVAPGDGSGRWHFVLPARAAAGDDAFPSALDPKSWL